MKIIICTRDLDYGVGSVVKTELIKYEKDSKIKKVVVIGSKKLKGYSKKIKFEVIENKGSFFITKEPNFAFQCNKKIKEITKKEKFDKIYLHFPIYAKNYGVEMIYRVHGLHKSIIENYPKNYKFLIGFVFHELYSYFDCRTMKYSDKISFVSKRTMEESKQFYPEFKKKFVYESNTIDKKKFYKLNKKKRMEIKKKEGIDNKKINILYVGRLDPLKGILDLIRIIKDLNNPKIRLLVIGEGPLKGEIQKHTFVRYFGKIPNEKLYKYYNIADLFVLPSYYENSPMTILEAKACGCKILARDVGDNKFNLKIDSIFKKNNFIQKLKGAI